MNVNRRDAMRLLLTGTSVTGMAALTQNVPWAVAEMQRAAASTSASGAIVRTILNDVPPDALGNGAVLLHEHLSLFGPPAAAELTRIIELVRKAGREGVSCIVDVGMTDVGRNINSLKQIASATDVHIVAGGGYSPAHTDVLKLHPDILTRREEQIADDLVRDARAAPRPIRRDWHRQPLWRRREGKRSDHCSRAQGVSRDRQSTRAHRSPHPHAHGLSSGS